MTRLFCLAAFVLALAGCFLFNNPYEYAAQFQVTVQGGAYAGTYVWVPADAAYEATVGNTRYYLYMDNSSNGIWCIASALNQSSGSVLRVDDGNSSTMFRALPPVLNTNWTHSDRLSGVDVSEGGICPSAGSPDGFVAQLQTLKVTFLPSDPGNTATYQWVGSTSRSGLPQNSLGTGPTYAVKPADYHTWIRVVIAPADSTGLTQGTAVTSPPVYVSS